MTSSSVTNRSPLSAPGDAWEKAFDLNDLRPRGFTDRVAQWFIDNPEWAFRIFRNWWPIPHVPFTNWWMITRFEDVQEVLTHDEAFEVPFGPKVMELNGGPNFLLGMTANSDYWRYQRQVMEAFRLEDVTQIVAPQARQMSEQIINSSAGRLDAIQDFITRVPTLLCEAYYGIPIPDPLKGAFAQWTLAMSTYMFADPSNRASYHRAALAASERVRDVVDNAIATATLSLPKRSTVLHRLLDMQRESPQQLTNEVIRAFLIGMVTGFIPTNTMAAGHMLEMLLRRADFMAAARASALADDDDLLKRCLFEAMRFKPLNPGPFRNCVADYTIGSGFLKTKRFRPGAKLLVGTQSAMFDERRVANPRKFDPTRPVSNYMLFGYGLHWCIGAFIAEAQITQTLKALLRHERLRRAVGHEGRLQLLGPFPQHLVVEFDL